MIGELMLANFASPPNIRNASPGSTLADRSVFVFRKHELVAIAVALWTIVSVSGAQNVADDRFLDWAQIRAQREERTARYLKTASDGYAWFVHAAQGDQGVPFLLLRILPELAPQIWGPPEEHLARFGFTVDPADANRPLPLGLAWVLNPKVGDSADGVHITTLSCAACHVGRVRLADGSLKLLVGAPNTQIDVRRYRNALERTAEQFMTGPSVHNSAKTISELIRSKPRGYFFRGYFGVDETAEDAARKPFENADALEKILSRLAQRIQAGRAAVEKQLRTSYSKSNAPPLDGGTPGQTDGSGDLIPKLLLARELDPTNPGGSIERFLESYYPELPFRNATATDNLSVWNQSQRIVGQLDGSVKSPFIRNVAAQVAVVGARNVNALNADIAARFTSQLPSPTYPFSVDIWRAARGRKLFESHCALCHKAQSDQVYGDEIGTDMNRARVVNNLAGRALLLNAFKSAFPQDYQATDAKGSNYRPADLRDDDILNDRSRPDLQGYLAGPLDGIWARAPYLHNGSVPTLRHLLAPNNPESVRPRVFLRGAIDYDEFNVGFLWDLRDAKALMASSPSAAVFDSGWDGASNQGHDRDMLIDGRVHRLDWSGAERRGDLDDLIEYLKSL